MYIVQPQSHYCLPPHQQGLSYSACTIFFYFFFLHGKYFQVILNDGSFVYLLHSCKSVLKCILDENYGLIVNYTPLPTPICGRNVG